MYNLVGKFLDGFIGFLSSAEVFISNMPLTIAALALSWVSMVGFRDDTHCAIHNQSCFASFISYRPPFPFTSKGCVWFKFMEENIISEKYILGTDRAGRDILSRLIYGARISLSIGFISVLISLFLGLLVRGSWRQGWRELWKKKREKNLSLTVFWMSEVLPKIPPCRR